MESKRLVGNAFGLVAGVLIASFIPPAHAQYNVGAALKTFTTAAAAQCGTLGGTSMAVVQGSRLAGVDSIRYPVVLAITCLDDAADATKRSTIYFVNPGKRLTENGGEVVTDPDGSVVTTLSTMIGGKITAPATNGWAHLVNRPDKGDLLGCGSNGALYSIDYNQFNNTPDGTATLLPLPPGLSSCVGLAWDAEEDVIYQAFNSDSSAAVAKFAQAADGTTTLLSSFDTPCLPRGLAVTGGVLVLALDCEGVRSIRRVDKNTGTLLEINGTVSESGVLLGDLACDPTTFGADFKDAMWSRNGTGGNEVVGLEFPAFTCGLPSNATVLSAGLSAPGPGQRPGELPLFACFGDDGKVLDTDGDGLPDCWESNGIDFNGDGVVDLPLCVQVDTNGDGIADATECANPDRKDIFVEIDWMQHHKPDHLALSQAQSVTSVKSVRAAFAAAPVSNPDFSFGISAHFQVDEQVSFMTLAGTGPVSHVNEIAFTPCTGPQNNAISRFDAADFDAIKKPNFGTAAERGGANSANTLNAKRLAFRYVLFAHKQIGANAQAGSGASGCAEVAGDDAVITLGSFASTNVGGVFHPRGNTDQQAGTFMHELGHTLGLRHGGGDGENCKPNYPSVMSYSRQFAGSPIPSRRLDYSRAQLPDLNENGLAETIGLRPPTTPPGPLDPSLSPLLPFFPLADQIAFGPTSWSVKTANLLSVDWSKNGTISSVPLLPRSINSGPGGCPTDTTASTLKGFNDWANLVYRTSTAIDFAGGVRTDTPEDVTREHEEEFFLSSDLDGNDVADARDCGVFECRHRIDIKPSRPLPKILKLGDEANVTVAIFSEASGLLVWNAPAQVQQDASLQLHVGSLVFPAKVSGNGTCSVSDIEDSETDDKDGIKDLKCQFPTSGMPVGTHDGIVSGFFLQNGQLRAFRARQEFTVLP